MSTWRLPSLAFALLSLGVGTQLRADEATLAQGERVFRNQCQGCHSLEPGVHIAGPSLHGVVGRHAGEIKDFEYSSVLQEAELKWTPDALDRFLTDPATFLPGTYMVFWGLERRSRQPLIEYLQDVGER